MTKRICLSVVVSTLLFAGVASAQEYPMLNLVADKVIQKYQQMSCEQMWQQKLNPQPKPQKEQEMLQVLKADPQMRTVFINKVAPVIVNKMFDCGMIP